MVNFFGFSFFMWRKPFLVSAYRLDSPKSHMNNFLNYIIHWGTRNFKKKFLHFHCFSSYQNVRGLDIPMNYFQLV